MKILIDETELDLLLEKKKQFIGKEVVWDSLLSAVSFLVSVFLATYKEIFGVPGAAIKTTFVMLGLFFTAKSVKDIWSGAKNNYSKEDIFKDINKLNQITHNHSIIAIKDTYSEFPNRFLVYDEPKWNCKLFLNYKTNQNNEKFIIDHISHELKIKSEDISIEYMSQKIHEKYSQNHKEMRVYCHRLYQVTLKTFPNIMQDNSFEIDGVQYYWMSISEMERDSRIREVNQDIVDFVKENCS